MSWRQDLPYGVINQELPVAGVAMPVRHESLPLTYDPHLQGRNSRPTFDIGPAKSCRATDVDLSLMYPGFRSDVAIKALI